MMLRFILLLGLCIYTPTLYAQGYRFQSSAETRQFIAENEFIFTNGTVQMPDLNPYRSQTETMVMDFLRVQGNALQDAPAQKINYIVSSWGKGWAGKVNAIIEIASSAAGLWVLEVERNEQPDTAIFFQAVAPHQFQAVSRITQQAYTTYSRARSEVALSAVTDALQQRELAYVNRRVQILKEACQMLNAHDVPPYELVMYFNRVQRPSVQYVDQAIVNTFDEAEKRLLDIMWQTQSVRRMMDVNGVLQEVLTFSQR